MLIIWLVYRNIAILCENAICNQISMAHFSYLTGLAGAEVIFEIWGIIKIFTRKPPPQDKSNMVITKRKTRKF